MEQVIDRRVMWIATPGRACLTVPELETTGRAKRELTRPTKHDVVRGHLSAKSPGTPSRAAPVAAKAFRRVSRSAVEKPDSTVLVGRAER